MDFKLAASQRAVLDVLDAVVDESGRERAFAVSAANEYDARLDVALHDALRGHSLTLLDRVLVADRLAELGTATTFGIGLTLGAVGLDAAPTPSVSVVGSTGLARFGAHANVAVAIVEGEARAVSLEGVGADPVRSGFGYPYARIAVAELERATILGRVASEQWRDAVALMRAAEIAGASAGALARVSAHLRSRVQFGRPLATLQALRHRLAEAAVTAEAIRWLVREAADRQSERTLAVAAEYAHQAAATLVPELVQFGGARSFAREFGMHVHTMRLEALRIELGPPDRLAARVNATPLLREAARAVDNADEAGGAEIHSRA